MKEINMKVVCVDDSINILTKGKTYEVISINDYEYFIKNDDGGFRWFHQNRFITLEEHRQKQLNKLI
jgi:urate oxidase